ncbi:MAG TPA: hypothetical protein VMT52_05895, partial [Planctomycetota bacterium]|nr:hypothetical protein [Planctomycetota bacterium]
MLRRGAPTLFIVLGLHVAGCSPEWYRRSADEEVYPILDGRRKTLVSTEALGEEMGPFRVEQTPLALAAVGSVGEVEDLKRVPAPRPTEEAVDDPGTAPGTGPPPAPPALPAGAPAVRAPGDPSEST